MKSHPVQVECYSGSRADERPRRITIDGREYVVAKLLGEWIEGSNDSTDHIRRFRVLTEDGNEIELWRTSEGAWYLESLR
jgi:hypothetical protein